MYNEYKDKLIASLNYYNEELSQDCLTFLQTDLKRRLSSGLPTPHLPLLLSTSGMKELTGKKP